MPGLSWWWYKSTLERSLGAFKMLLNLKIFSKINGNFWNTLVSLNVFWNFSRAGDDFFLKIWEQFISCYDWLYLSKMRGSAFCTHGVNPTIGGMLVLWACYLMKMKLDYICKECILYCSTNNSQHPSLRLPGIFTPNIQMVCAGFTRNYRWL